MVDGDWGRAVQGVHCVGGDGGKGPDGRIDCIDVMVEAYCRFGMGIFEWVDQSVFCFAQEKKCREETIRVPKFTRLARDMPVYEISPAAEQSDK